MCSLSYLLMLVFADLALAYVYALLLYEIKLMGRSMHCYDLSRQTCHEHIKSRLLLFLKECTKGLTPLSVAVWI